MGRIYKWLGSHEQAKQLWENREALDKYLARLKELMGEENQGKNAQECDATDASSETEILLQNQPETKNPLHAERSED